jgi:cytochrome b561
MAAKNSTVADAIALGMAKKLMFTLFLVCSAVIWLPVVLLDDKFPKLHLKTIGGSIGFLCLVLSWLLGNGVASLMQGDPSMKFGTAFAHTFYAYLGMLCFLPIVGSFFERFFNREKPINPFHETQGKFPQNPAP